jgi:hypothetical protein
VYKHQSGAEEVFDIPREGSFYIYGIPTWKRRYQNSTERGLRKREPVPAGGLPVR